MRRGRRSPRKTGATSSTSHRRMRRRCLRRSRRRSHPERTANTSSRAGPARWSGRAMIGRMQARTRLACALLLVAGCGGRTEPLVAEPIAEFDAQSDTATDANIDVADVADAVEVIDTPLDDGRIPRCGDGI